MNPRLRRRLRITGLALAAMAYVLLLHHFTAAGEPSAAGALLAIAPMGLGALALAWRTRARLGVLALTAATLAGLALAWPLLEANFALVGLVQHAGTFALLALAFGRTLAAGRTPMVSQFARRVHGELAAPLARYTRRVTLAWTAFFAVMSATSLALFFGGPIAHWSLLANLLTPLLIAALFAGEFLMRQLVLPPHLRTGLRESIRSAWRPATPQR